eukprot:TRINITY_DN43975_c0_g1_i1.p1 TRINITY_DN43975_c0_g1~~TRINITY_DN43975_c0_g1_i1.p1  ORF type:complete len:335 (-),score=78.11 TRINITY_DN43975_c0_g1_i1:97-1101(-)
MGCIEERSKAFTPVVSRQLCMARVWAGGIGGQCPLFPVVHGLCKKHFTAQSSGTLSHGRVDGPVPEAKLAEFEAAAQRLGATSSRSSASGGSAPSSSASGSRSSASSGGAQSSGSRASASKSANAAKEPPVRRSAAKAASSVPVEEPQAREAAEEAAAAMSSGSAKPSGRGRGGQRDSAATRVDEPAQDRGQSAGEPLACMARIWGGGRGGQCSKKAEEQGGFCKMHRADAKKHGGLPSHGRIDGEIPTGKLEAFRVAAEKNGWPMPTAGGAAASSTAAARAEPSPATQKRRKETPAPAAAPSPEPSAEAAREAAPPRKRYRLRSIDPYAADVE